MIDPRFDASLERFGDSPAIISEDGSCLTYAELAGRVSQLQKIISNDKQLIFIQSGLNTPSLVCYLAALRAGHTAMLVSNALNTKKIAELQQQYQPEWIFEPVQAHRSYAYEEDGYGLRQSGDEASKPIHPDLALLLSTSGTTGSPKMVKLSKENLYANVGSIIKYLSIDQDDRAITSLPMHYSYGLSVINTHLAAGGAIILTEKSIMTRAFWNTFTTHKATSLAGVPYHYEMLLRLRFFEMELTSLKTLTQAGGRLHPKYVGKFADHALKNDIRFFVMYGQTEATARISYVPPDSIQKKPASIGVAIPGGKLLLQDSTGKEIIEDNQEGELIYQGANVMMGYAICREDLTTDDEFCGILPTGDLAIRDQDGFFTITGRLKRFVKIFGNRVNLDEVEQLLKNHGFEALCGGEDNNMLIAVTDPLVQSAIKKCITADLGIHQSAITTVVVPKFRHTEAGKIDYKQTFQLMD